MGFDLYGLNPTINKVYPPRYNEIMEEYGKDGMLNWKKTYLRILKMNTLNLKITMKKKIQVVTLEITYGFGDRYGILFVKVVMIS